MYYIIIKLLGISEMRNSSVTIIGVAKDVADHLPYILEQIEELSRQFKYSRAIFVEGDSVDNTLNKFVKWANQSNANRTIFTNSAKNKREYLNKSDFNFNNNLLPREGRITIARNIALESYRNISSQQFPTDYVIVIDLDIVVSLFTIFSNKYIMLILKTITVIITINNAITILIIITIIKGFLLDGIRDSFAKMVNRNHSYYRKNNIQIVTSYCYCYYFNNSSINKLIIFQR